MTKFITALTIAASLFTGLGLASMARADEGKPALRTTSCDGKRTLKTPTFRVCKVKGAKAPRPTKGKPATASLIRDCANPTEANEGRCEAAGL